MAGLPWLAFLLFSADLVLGRYNQIAPTQTAYADDKPDPWGWTPKPTGRPFSLDPFDSFDPGLLKRQQTGLNLCGYVSNSQGQIAIIVKNCMSHGDLVNIR